MFFDSGKLFPIWGEGWLRSKKPVHRGDTRKGPCAEKAGKKEKIKSGLTAGKKTHPTISKSRFKTFKLEKKKVTLSQGKKKLPRRYRPPLRPEEKGNRRRPQPAQLHKLQPWQKTERKGKGGQKHLRKNTCDERRSPSLVGDRGLFGQTRRGGSQAR